MSDTYKINSPCQPSDDVITIDWGRADSLDYNNSTLPLFNDISMISGATGSNTVSIHGANLVPNVYITTGTSTGFNIDESFANSLHASNNLSLQGEDADIVINGVSLKDTLNSIQDRLAMLTPNPELEKEWDQLRKLRERYQRLEKKCMKKSQVWNKLKSMPPPEIL